MWDFVEICVLIVVSFNKLTLISVRQPRLLAGLSGVLLPNLFELTVDGEQGFRVSVKRDDD